MEAVDPTSKNSQLSQLQATRAVDLTDEIVQNELRQNNELIITLKARLQQEVFEKYELICHHKLELARKDEYIRFLKDQMDRQAKLTNELIEQQRSIQNLLNIRVNELTTNKTFKAIIIYNSELIDRFEME